MASICTDDRFGFAGSVPHAEQSASARHVKRLIASAQHTLFMQFQYIELPKTPGDLVDLAADCARAHE
jgi:hypothetical protein